MILALLIALHCQSFVNIIFFYMDFKIHLFGSDVNWYSYWDIIKYLITLANIDLLVISGHPKKMVGLPICSCHFLFYSVAF